MNKILIAIIFAFVSQVGFAQVKKDQKINEKDPEVFPAQELEIKPEFPGGISAFFKFVGKSFQIPDDEKFKGGKVYASFIIDVDGSLTDIKILKDCGFGTDAEYKRVLLLSPKWAPGYKDGKPVKVFYTLPITLSSN